MVRRRSRPGCGAVGCSPRQPRSAGADRSAGSAPATGAARSTGSARWLQKNPSLKDAALAEALKGQDWDPSVKSICGFPEVLERMDQNLSWIQDLGDAFLSQQAGLMDAVQRMRAKAYASGNLKSSEQQKVTQTSESFVVIEPANPEVIYVPTYSPTVVYGGWGYPSYYYPTMYVPPPPGRRVHDLHGRRRLWCGGLGAR